MDDAVFRALNDPSRRLLLDAMFNEDGQSVGELATLLPQMTRFGVMNHLTVLEEAGLVTTKKEGRRKLHFLNPVPIQLVHQRWITKYTEGRLRTMTDLKTNLEATNTNPTPDHVYQVIINAPQARVWDAIVNGAVTEKYFYGTHVDSTWEQGAPITYTLPDGDLAADGMVNAIEPGRMVDMTFVARWDPELVEEGPSREVWIVEDFNGASKLTMELYDTPEGSKRHSDFTTGFPYIISGMKTYLETGEMLPTPNGS